MEATMKVRDSLIGLWLERVISNINAEIGYLPSYLHVKEAEEKVEEILEKLRAEKAESDAAKPINHVWNANKMAFDKTDAEDDYDYDIDPIMGAQHFNGSAMGMNIELSDDQLDNFLDDAVVDLKPKTREDAKIYRMVLLSVLCLCNKITAVQCIKRCNNDTDNVIMCNSIFKFFSGFPVFSGYNALEVSEYMSRKQILDVMQYLNQKSMFDVDYAFAGFLNKAQEEFVAEERRVKSNNGEKPVSDDEIITPIIFNNAYLNSVDLMEGNVPDPQIAPSVKKIIEQKVSKITGIKVNKDAKREGYDIRVKGKKDPFAANSCADTGLAEVEIVDKATDIIRKKFTVDLDNITATGLNIEVMVANNATGQLQSTYANFDKDADVCMKVLMSPKEYIINPDTPEGQAEIKKLEAKFLHNAAVYGYFDFSAMHKNLDSMNDEQKAKFTELLMKIIDEIPWYNVPGNLIGIGCPRFRFRDFKACDDFTVISDKNVRVQDRSGMALPYNNPIGKVYMDRYDSRATDDKLVVHVYNKGNSYVVSLNGEKLDLSNSNK